MENKNYVLHKAETRGHANHGWLDTYHTFSFAGYYDPQRIHFGALRVLNDDSVAGGMGFGTHPHNNMEIITIPLSGEIAHKDSMGNSGVIKSGEIQVMSAGTGIYHSEFNHLPDTELKFLQIWVFPDKQDVTPRYDQLALPQAKRNELQQVLSPNADDAGVWIHQQAWFHQGTFDAGTSTTHALERPATHGIYAFLLEGEATINGVALKRRDGIGIWNEASLQLDFTAASKLLLMEVPLEV